MSNRHVGATVPAPAMPGFVKTALATRKLEDAYRARPKYQQTEYLNWIHAAKLEGEKKKRVAQMLEELAAGSGFKGEPWTPPAPATAT